MRREIQIYCSFTFQTHLYKLEYRKVTRKITKHHTLNSIPMVFYHKPLILNFPKVYIAHSWYNIISVSRKHNFPNPPQRKQSQTHLIYGMLKLCSSTLWQYRFWSLQLRTTNHVYVPKLWEKLFVEPLMDWNFCSQPTTNFLLAKAKY